MCGGKQGRYIMRNTARTPHSLHTANGTTTPQKLPSAAMTP